MHNYTDADYEAMDRAAERKKITDREREQYEKANPLHTVPLTEREINHIQLGLAGMREQELLNKLYGAEFMTFTTREKL